MWRVNNLPFVKKNKNHVIDSRELGMADETDTTLHKWVSVVLKRGVVVVKNRTTVKCSCEETFGSLVSKVAPEFQEERVKWIVISTD